MRSEETELAERDAPDAAEVRTGETAAVRKAVLITGAAGYVGRLVMQALAREPGTLQTIVATDLRALPGHEVPAGVIFEAADIRSGRIGELMAQHHIDTVVHLAAVVTPRPGDSRQMQYEVDVEGTRNVVEACVAHGVAKLVYTSSGAAYGYSPDNAALLKEDDPLRGNEAFAYAWHKRLVEEMLATYRETHPELAQLVLRVSTVLGPTVNNQITAMFERPLVVGVRGADTPFCFIWDQDLVDCIARGVHGAGAGVYNITGDGVMTLREIAHAMHRRYVPIPVGVLTAALGMLSERKWTAYGPEQVMFLRYRPVLDNHKLKTDFGFRPQRTSRQVFELYRAARA